MIRKQIALILICSVLTACRWNHSDDNATASTNSAPNIPVQNSPPTISGAPSTSITAGTAYSFVPQATDANNQTLTFSITSKPGWATFDAATGRLQGTPAVADVGMFSAIVISVSDGMASTSLPAFGIQVNAASVANRPPTISGTAPASASAGQAYTFTPSASDPDGQALTFSITNKPAWASFNTATGQMSGTPTTANLGTASGITIGVTDGTATASLTSFAISVAMPPGTAELNWTKPTRNDDGTALTDLAGYKIRYGTSVGTLTQLLPLPSANILSASFEGLTTGNWYFTIASYTIAGVESVQSSAVSVSVR